MPPSSPRRLLMQLAMMAASVVISFVMVECAFRVLRGGQVGLAAADAARIETLSRRLFELRNTLRDRATGRVGGGSDPVSIVETSVSALTSLSTDWSEGVRSLRGRPGLTEDVLVELVAAQKALELARDGARRGLELLRAGTPVVGADWAPAMFTALDDARARTIAATNRLEEARAKFAYSVRMETADGEPLNLLAVAHSDAVVPLTGVPRPRYVFSEGFEWRLCYSPPTVPYLDARGCVSIRVNSRGCREREELCEPKPPGQIRVVCLGDSFTIGWGVREEHTWPRTVEKRLRRGVRARDLRFVNCGFAGTLSIDEYAAGLIGRFKDYEPDVVVAAIYGNDVIATNSGLCHFNQRVGRGEVLPWWQSRMLAAAAELFASGGEYPMAARLRFDHDVSAELLKLDPGDPRYEGSDPDMYWPSGRPAEALLQMQSWCAERGIAFGVVMWPFLQGLGESEFYPFASMHDAVAGFCHDKGIPFKDLLPVLKGRCTDDLWVSPADMHANELAISIVAPTIAAFVEEMLPR